MSTTNPRNGGTNNDDDTQHGGYWYAESQGRSHADFYPMNNLWRYNRKGGNEDLEKAIWYTNKLISENDNDAELT